MKCEQVQKSLADYRSGLISDGRSAKIKGHVSSCPLCAKELKVLDDVLALVEASELQCEPPIGLWNGIHNRITTPAPRFSWLREKMGDILVRPIRAAGVGLAAAAVIAGLVIAGVNHNGAPSQSVTERDQYVQGHALYASQSPLADQVSYLTVAAASSDQTQSETN